ncbi:MAG: family 20 glycosylhydrolase [Cyclobacteriaceae bacterium]|nr:family 20 glycosylhydrolase [Cyclobacteriaceae bacterium]
MESASLSLPDSLYIFIGSEALNPLFTVLKVECKSLYQTELIRSTQSTEAVIVLSIDDSLPHDAYRIHIDDHIEIKGGSYQAVAMGSISLLQSINQENGATSILKGTIHDYPDLPFRGLLVDLARRKHRLPVLKQIVSLCRWYKVSHLHLHLTDDYAFRFPSDAYPQLITREFYYKKEELAELIAFANARGVEIIPELEVPGHAGEFIRKMPEIFAFDDEKLNRNTINMANDEIYTVLDTLIGEIAEVFYSSPYMHIGGDEPDFSAMADDPQMQQYLKEKNLDSVEALYWHFINQMHQFVAKRGKQTIVWEGFAKEGNKVISKDIIVMAWETMYQLPSELLDAGFKMINVSWKPLYVVNSRKWEARDIYHWNVYQWQNWLPEAPSYDTIQIDAHEHILGASMASWDQPEYAEISSLRRRIPAMTERVWNVERELSTDEFEKSLERLDIKLSDYFSPVQLQASGLRFPQILDGRRDEQIWFDDTLKLHLHTPANVAVRFTSDGKPVSASSPVYEDTLRFWQSTTLRYQAFTALGEPVGHEILTYYELHPLRVTFSGENLIGEDERWERVDSWRFPFYQGLNLHITAARPGIIRVEMGENDLNANSPVYQEAMKIEKDAVVKAGLFNGDSLIGHIWSEHFIKLEE